jgi:hypothetical protein
MKLEPRSYSAVIALICSLLAGTLASPAQAAAGDLTCTADQRTTYSPGVTFVPSQQNIHVTGTFPVCASVSNPEITSGSIDFSFQGTKSCLALDRTIKGTSGILWNTGETTTYTYTSTTATIAGQIVVTIVGTVIAGAFQGNTITVVTVSPATNLLNCLAPPGITSRIGVGILTIE